MSVAESLNARLASFGSNPFAVEPTAECQAIVGKRKRDLKTGVLAACSNTPGVYGFLDEHGVLIYAGKSKRLRARLLSYFSRKVSRQKQGWMIRKARSILWEPASTEFAALLRELHIIQTWRPSFNVKDAPHCGQSTYLCLGRPAAPGFFISAEPKTPPIQRYGPFWAGPKLEKACDTLNRIFQLRDCPDNQAMVFPGDATKPMAVERAGCLRFDLGTCLGPCIAAVSERSYGKKIKEARDFLAGKTKRCVSDLKMRMATASANRQFEIAARCRDDLASLEFLKRRLARIRRIEKELNFIYAPEAPPGQTLWYHIQAGRVVNVEKPPRGDSVAKKGVARPTAAPMNSAAKHPDTLLLIASWFRKHPAEIKRTMPLKKR